MRIKCELTHLVNVFFWTCSLSSRKLKADYVCSNIAFNLCVCCIRFRSLIFLLNTSCNTWSFRFWFFEMPGDLGMRSTIPDSPGASALTSLSRLLMNGADTETWPRLGALILRHVEEAFQVSKNSNCCMNHFYQDTMKRGWKKVIHLNLNS